MCTGTFVMYFTLLWSRFTEWIGNTHNIYVSDQGKLFFTRSCMLLLTLLQRCAPSFAQNRFVMYITHVHRYVCYVFHFVMYIISFLCWLGQSLSMFAPICYNNIKVCSCQFDNYWVCDLSHSPNLKLHPEGILCRFDVCNMTPKVICWLICAILCIQGFLYMNVLCI